MKPYTTYSVLVMAMVAMLGCFNVIAGESPMLTRAQWLEQVGACVTDAAVMRKTVLQVLPDERVEFTQRILKAVKRLPINPAEKAPVFLQTSVACIAGATGDTRFKVIAEVFADVPVEFLPVLTEALAKRFDQTYNNLSDEQYEHIASEVVKIALVRNVQTDEPSVRNTFVILAFLRGSKNPKLRDVLLAFLSKDRGRSLAISWIDPALKSGDYEGLLAAADVEAIGLSRESILHLVGHTSMDRLLANLDQNLLPADGDPWGGLPNSGLTEPVDVGINRLPRGYQNQINHP